MKVSGLSSLNSSHSVTIIQQSAFLRHSIAEEAYLILSMKINLALEIAKGSYAVTLVLSFNSWFMRGMDRASLMSSVSGLKAKPRMAIFLPFKLLKKLLQS